jgi:hypothetical protein
MKEIISFQDCSNETCEVHKADYANDVFYMGRRGGHPWMCVSIERLEKILSACKEAELAAKNSKKTRGLKNA